MAHFIDDAWRGRKINVFFFVLIRLKFLVQTEKFGGILDTTSLKSEAIYMYLRDEPKKYMDENVVKQYGTSISEMLLVAKKNDFFFDDERKQPDYYGMANYLKFFHHLFIDNSGMYIWSDEKKHYSIATDDHLLSLIGELTSQKVKPTQLKNFLNTIKIVSFDKNKNLKKHGFVNLKNGVLEVKTGKLFPHSPDFFFTSIIPIDFNASASCPKWLEFLDNIFPENKEYICVIAQIFGYILMGGYPFLHKAFVLYGEGRNGKSTLLHVLDQLVGKENFSSVSLANLDKPFSVVGLHGKLANISGETPSDKINSEIFKEATSGEWLVGARKFQDEFQFKCEARFIFACNELPKFGENTVGMEERLYFIPFKRFFKKEERDHDIKKKLDLELSGILNWALVGLEILTDEKRLPELEASKAIMDEYKEENDSVYSWCQGRFAFDEGALAFTSKGIYPTYREDMKGTGRHPVSEHTFFKRLKKYLKGQDWFDEDKMFDKKSKYYKHIKTLELIHKNNFGSASKPSWVNSYN